MRPVYISSNAFPIKTIDAIFTECDRHAITHLELGSGVAYDPEAREKIIARSKNTKILLHNYIPAPLQPFVLNLASDEKEVAKKSFDLVVTALQISAKIGAPFFAVHSGFAYHAEPQLLGKKQIHLEHFSLLTATTNFLENIQQLAAIAKQFGVRLLVENNVVPRFNLIDGQNKSYLVAGFEDSLNILEKISQWGVGLLLDTGHLNVSAKSLGFNRIDFVAQVRQYIYAFQVSNNDGSEDQHKPIEKTDWSVDLVKSFPEEVFVTLEVNNHLPQVLKSSTWLQ